MTTTIDAIYEDGKLVLPRPLSLPEKTHVRVTIETDSEREVWLKLSEESLGNVWGNHADDVYSQLAVMATDAQIQSELRAINAEFGATESDGLNKF